MASRPGGQKLVINGQACPCPYANYGIGSFTGTGTGTPDRSQVVEPFRGGSRERPPYDLVVDLVVVVYLDVNFDGNGDVNMAAQALTHANGVAGSAGDRCLVAQS
jgi:hypothetical protein